MSKRKGLGKIVFIVLLCILFVQVLMPIEGAFSQKDSSQSELFSDDLQSTDSAEIDSLGPMQAGTIKFAIGLNNRNNDKLQNFIDSSHSITHGVQKVLSEEEYEAEYSPSQSYYDQVLSYLLANNITVTETWQNRLLITAEGSVEDVARAFQTQIGMYSYQDTVYYASTTDIAVPAALSSYGITGIDVNSFPVQPLIEKVSGFAEPAGLAFNQSPSDFRNVYGTSTAVSNGWTGTGRTIGIVDAYGDPTIVTDVESFNSYFGLPRLSLTVAGIGGNDSNWATETALDVQWAHAMAPGAAITLQLAADNSYSSLFGAVNTLVEQNDPPDIISLSFGGDETGIYSHIFASAAAKGIKVYASTGDDGAYNDESSLSVSYPASDPNVIAVGGTTLYSKTVQGTDQYYEYGWSGSGGGYSHIFTEPSYQTNAGIPNTANKRAIPDVSLEADPHSGVSIYIGGVRQTGWGGTSLSAPMMAGIAAVALNGDWHLDNYAFYSTYGTSMYPVSFHDVYLSGNNGYYSAQAGWDAVTGLGSINFHNFINFNGVYSEVGLTSETLSTSSVGINSLFDFNYNLNNPSDNSLTQIGLGATIRLHGSTNEINDLANDIYVNLNGGESSQSRAFTTSSFITPGLYDVQWSVWLGPPGYGTLLSSSGWQTDQLEILSSSFEFDFHLSATPSSSTIAPGGAASYLITSMLTSGTATPVILSCANSTQGFSFSFNQSLGNPTYFSNFSIQTSTTIPQGKYAIIISGTGGEKTHSIVLTLNVGDIYEPDNSFTEYSSMTLTTSLQSQSRSIEPAADNDYIRFYGSPGTYTFYTSGSLDTFGYLYDSDQNLLALNDDSGGNLQFMINYQILDSGYYFLRVKDFLTSNNGSYTLYYQYEPAPLPPARMSPVDGAINASSSEVFTWSSSQDATLYQLQVLGPSPGLYNTTETGYSLLSLNEGQYTWRIRAFNNSGWSDWTSEWGFSLDMTPPSTPGPDDGVSGWLINSTPTFSWSANDTVSGLAGYYWRVDDGPELWTTTSFVTLNIQTDGNHNFYVKATDNAGNNGTYGSHAFQLDTTYPSGSITINQASQFSTSTSVTLSLSYFDQTSGVDRVRYGNDAVWDTEVWEFASLSKAWTLLSGDGSKTVYYQIRDMAGLISVYSAIISLDTAPPTGSLSINNGAAYTTSTPVTLTVISTDSVSGVGQVRFSNDGVWDIEQWENPLTNKAWTLTTDEGAKTVYMELKDNVGLISTYNASIILDITPPIADAGEGQTVDVGNSVSFDAGKSTDISGIVSYLWDFGDGIQGEGVTVTHTYDRAGLFTATLTVYDAAHNTAAASIIIIVQGQPTPTPTAVPTARPNSNPTTSPTANPISKPTSSPTATPNPTLTPGQTLIEVTADSGKTVQLTIEGNITASQITNAFIQVNQSAATTTFSFLITGESGTSGYGNITIPKDKLTLGPAPQIYIDGQLADFQGYTQDANNYYVWYTTHFSKYELSIIFTNEQTSADYALSLFLAIVIVVIICIFGAVLFLRRQEKTEK